MHKNALILKYQRIFSTYIKVKMEGTGATAMAGGKARITAELDSTKILEFIDRTMSGTVEWDCIIAYKNSA